MKSARSTLIVVAAIAAIGASATPSMGQKYKKGDKVVALTDTDLKIEATNTGTVRRGQVLVVARTEGEWLWIESNLGPDKLEDCLPFLRLAGLRVTLRKEGDPSTTVTLQVADPVGVYNYYTTSGIDDPWGARWTKPSGKPVQGWIHSSSVAPAIDLRVQGRQLYYSVPDAERLTRRPAPKDGLWDFGILCLAIIKADPASRQSDGISGQLYVQPVAVKQPNNLDLPSGRCGVFLVVTRPGQSPMPGSSLVVVE